MELNGFDTVMLICGLQHPEYVFSYYNSKLNVCAYYPSLEDGCFIIRTMNKTNSALKHKQNYTKYSINRTVVMNKGQFFKVYPYIYIVIAH